MILVYKVFKESLVCLDPKDHPVRWDFPVRLVHKVSRVTVVMMVLTAKTVPLVNQAYRVKRVSPVSRESKAILVNEEILAAEVSQVRLDPVVCLDQWECKDHAVLKVHEVRSVNVAIQVNLGPWVQPVETPIWKK